MAQGNKIEVKLFSSGFCTAHARVVDPVNGKGKTKFEAVWALLKHPEWGYLLFDTGYSERFTTATESFPERFYRWATPMTLPKGNSAIELLHKEGIAAEEIKYIIVSHFHGDHICGLLDFQKAKFICTQTAFEQMKKVSGFSAVSKGILKKLIPGDFEKRVLFVEQISTLSKDASGLTIYHLFKDENLKMILLPGHARGMLGFIVEWRNGILFYGTDAAWSRDTFLKKILPKKIVKLFFDSWNDFVDTQEKMRAFSKQNPETTIVFTHCPETIPYLENHV